MISPPPELAFIPDCRIGVMRSLGSAFEMSDALTSHQVSSESLLEQVFAEIDRLDADLHAFISVADRHELLVSAREIDARRERGEEVGRYAGIPIAVKDNIAVTGQRLTCGSLMLKDYVPPYEATAVARIKAAGLIIVGKTNLDEFGFGSSTENSAFFPTRNPRVRDRVPGGSSGGSAAAVASGMVPWALGTDTGGSIRQPASLCGVVGLRPTYGRVSRYGLVSFASSMDQIGPISTNVHDAAALLSIIMGDDPLDSTSRSDLKPVVWNESSSRPLVVGVPKQYIGEAVDAEVAATVESVTGAMSRIGWEVREVSLPLTEYALPIYYLISSVEAASNLARFDGVKYGHRSGKARNYEELVPLSRAEAFGAEVKRRIMLGTYASSKGYSDQYYNRAYRAREVLQAEFANVFKEVDLLLGPTSPTAAWPLGERVADPLKMWMSDVLSIPAALAGIPAIAIPVTNDLAGCPIGIQLTAPFGGESTLFMAASMLESFGSDAKPHCG